MAFEAYHKAWMGQVFEEKTLSAKGRDQAKREQHNTRQRQQRTEKQDKRSEQFHRLDHLTSGSKIVELKEMLAADVARNKPDLASAESATFEQKDPAATQQETCSNSRQDDFVLEQYAFADPAAASVSLQRAPLHEEPQQQVPLHEEPAHGSVSAQPVSPNEASTSTVREAAPEATANLRQTAQRSCFTLEREAPPASRGTLDRGVNAADAKAALLAPLLTSVQEAPSRLVHSAPRIERGAPAVTLEQRGASSSSSSGPSENCIPWTRLQHQDNALDNDSAWACGLSASPASASSSLAFAQAQCSHGDLLPPGCVTLMMQIPDCVTQPILLMRIAEAGFGGSFDFFYLPIQQNTQTPHIQHAYLNFKAPELALDFYRVFHGRRFFDIVINSIVHLAAADFQGYEATERAFKARGKLHSKRSGQPLFLRAGHIQASESTPVPKADVMFVRL